MNKRPKTIYDLDYDEQKVAAYKKQTRGLEPTLHATL